MTGWHGLAAVLLLTAAAPVPATAQETPDPAPLFAAADADPQSLNVLRGAFSCPLDLLTDLYGSLAGDEVLEVLTVETEVLLICRERQERLRRIATAEAELRRLLGVPDPGPGAARVSVAEGGLAVPPLPVRSCAPTTDPVAEERIAGGTPPPDPNGIDAGQATEGTADLSERDADRSPALPSVPAIGAGEGGRQALARVLSGLVGGGGDAGGGAVCGVEWNWVWTTRDVSGVRAAMLRSADGEEREVRERDRLPGGAAIEAIGAAGVTLRRPDGSVERLPRAAAVPLPQAAPAPDPDSDAGAGPEEPPEIPDSIRALIGDGAG